MVLARGSGLHSKQTVECNGLTRFVVSCCKDKLGLNLDQNYHCDYVVGELRAYPTIRDARSCIVAKRSLVTTCALSMD